MTIGLITARHRRALALGAATCVVHVLALWWIMPQLRAANLGGETVVETRLVAVAPPERRPEPPPKPKPLVPKRRAPAPPAPPTIVQAEAVEPGAAQKLSDVQSVQTATADPETPAAEPVAAPPAPAAAAPRQYRVDLPPSARIMLDVERTDADGARWHGEQAIAWTLSGGRYRMTVEAGIRVLVRVNLLVLESVGKAGAAGFVPETMTEKRRGKAQTATRFGDGRITFSASPASYDLLPGAQDKATVPLQLAAIARADVSQLDGGIDILVGEDKDASVFRFVALGQEVIDTGLGRMHALHLSRPPRAGAYGSRLDIWLAPALGWLPVRIRNTEASGAVTTQTVNKIQTMDVGS
ncbi:DUF3108 domain-containing protein [Massilia sp. R2A-15]|uniref:DUF3108 domain-containing protein n=1 Tax=Massilia sp. R2A-15 TaxID=3064278 RepID=UPI0027330839|nr:DUF3108 domain-containing protein [Massilia sp. R2A-15]WLI89565.1 DUF3108 domain-containing protein [Massilia sp. R2A-15]